MNSLEVADQLNQRLLDLIEARFQNLSENGENPVDEIMEDESLEGMHQLIPSSPQNVSPQQELNVSQSEDMDINQYGMEQAVSTDSRVVIITKSNVEKLTPVIQAP